MEFGLLGRKLGHSYSPQIHSYLAPYNYRLFEKEPDELDAYFLNSSFQGINVTIPYKKTVMSYCAALSPCAEKMGAVNTIVRRKDGSLIGHNTDYFGFTYMVQRSGLQVADKKVLVLGSGGASVTAIAVLKELGSHVIVISRSGENNYQNIARHADAAVIVNATPVGMYPNNGVSPVDLQLFPKLEGVLDMIYNPARTQLLMDAESRGLVAENGLWMLVAQAKESAEWFTGCSIQNDVIPEIYYKLRSQMENIVLIGMPGCGKSSIGKLLAQRMNRVFADADSLVEEMAQKRIPEIFSESGEEVFRKWETLALSELCKQSSLIIATGGGCVTRPDNYPILHQNSIIVWIERELKLLPTDGRPLSKAGQMEEMYAARAPLYRCFSDLAISNHETPSNTVDAILSTLYKEVTG